MKRHPTAVAVLVALLALSCTGCALWSDSAVAPLARMYDTPDPTGYEPPSSHQGRGDGGLLLIAFDRATAERAWEALVPEGLDRERGVADTQGLYGSLGDVDFDTQVVAAWSADQSGGCAAWLGDVTLAEDGSLAGDIGSKYEGGDCEAIGVPYHMLVAIDREAVPSAQELPATMALREGDDNASRALVDQYPGP